MCSLQKKQDIFKFSGFRSVIAVWQCGQGIFWPRLRAEKAICPLQWAQKAFNRISSGLARKFQINSAALPANRYKNEKLKRPTVRLLEMSKVFAKVLTYPRRLCTPCHCNPSR